LSIRLGGEDEGGANIATDARIARNAERNDPALAALYCQYGRYLTIAGSRPNGMPTTLQGLWNDRLAPAWDSKYTININTEMNYWLTATGNLPECCLPLFELTKNASLSGARTAAAQYGASGWVAHHNLDAWMGTSVVDRVFHGMWPTGGAWLCKSIWDHYEYTGDREMLSQNYELLKGASLFFIDTLVEHPEKKWLVTCPSNSPENAHHTDVSICAGPAMDMSILRDLFAATAEASKILNIDGDFRDEVLRARERLAPLQIGSTGKLQEWLDDWDDIAPEQDHRHVSHLYALYPSSQITVNENPEFAEACRQTLIARGDESTGWATAWRIALWARLYEAEHAHKILSFLLTPERTAPNMFDLHPPFQIDGNFGGAAAILEMLVQSHEVSESGERIVRLLPALPKSWDEGKVAGVLVRGGFEVGIIWTNGVLEAVTIKSLLGNHAIVSYNGKLLAMDLGAGETCGIEWSGKELRKLPASY
jgi:alpha-L-fucosidase 2